MMLWIIDLSSYFAVAFAETIVTEVVTKAGPVDPLRQASWCPTFQVGTQCPENTFMFFYKCCGHLHKECCSHLRVWVLVMIIALPLLFIVPPAVYLLRRMLCQDHRRYSSGIQMTTRETREARRSAK